MKKLLGIGIMVLALCAFSISSANAAGPWCLTLTNFCDRLQLARDDASGNLYGGWDLDCNSTFSFKVSGSARSQVNNVVAEAIGWSVQFYFNVPGRTFEQWIYDGVNPPGINQQNQPWTVTGGNCPVLVESGLPASLN